MIVWQLGREKAPVPRRATRLAAFALVPAVSAAAWFAYFRLIYGTFNPAAPYGANAGADTSPAFIPGAMAGILFDQQFGLLVYSPVFFAAVVAGVASIHGPPGDLAAGVRRRRHPVPRRDRPVLDVVGRRAGAARAIHHRRAAASGDRSGRDMGVRRAAVRDCCGPAR